MCRVKELTKEAAKRSNSILSSASHPTATEPRSTETVPDIVPHQMMRRPSTKPSLFHPSDIQLSSTPLKNAAVATVPRSDDTDVNSLLLDGENDLPISGHHLSSGSSTNHDRRRSGRSPIQDSLQHEVTSASLKSNSKHLSSNEAKIPEDLGEPADNGIERSHPEISNVVHLSTQEGGMQAAVVASRSDLERNDRASPCSCRCSNSSFVNSQLSLQLECDGSFSSSSGKPGTHNFPPVYHLPSPGTSPKQLFAETKARMENARTNIRDFLYSEKTRTADSSRSSNLALARSKETISTDLVTVNHTGLDRKTERRSLEKVLQKVPSTENMFVNLNRGTGLPDDDVVTETESFGGPNVSNERCEKSRVSHEVSGRSWAEIFEQSSDSCSRSCPLITAAVVPDLSCSCLLYTSLSPRD